MLPVEYDLIRNVADRMFRAHLGPALTPVDRRPQPAMVEPGEDLVSAGRCHHHADTEDAPLSRADIGGSAYPTHGLRCCRRASGGLPALGCAHAVRRNREPARK